MSKTLRQVSSLYDMYKAGDYFNAELGVREILENAPHDVHALKLGALTALAINQTVTSHQRLDLAITLAPMSAELANIQGRVLKASGDWAAAEEAYNLAERMDPSFARVKMNKLSLFLVSDQPKRVLEELETNFNFGESGIFAKSHALIELGRFIEALTLLDKSAAELSSDQKLFYSIKCFAGLRKLDDMSEAFNKLSSDSHLYAKALSVVVNSYEMNGLREKCVAVIESLPSDCPVQVQVEISRLWKSIERPNKANSYLNLISNRFPKNIIVLREKADAARLSGNIEKSYELYRTALELEPGDFMTMTGFAQTAITASRFEEAQTLLQSALAQAPNNQLLLALVAVLLRKMGADTSRLYDYENFVKVYDLSPPKGYSDISSFNSALKQKLDTLHIYKCAPIKQTLRQGSQTETDLSVSDDPVIRAFFDIIDTPIRSYIDELNWNPNHPLLRRKRKNYRISGAWSIRLSEDGHHVNHVHPMGWISSAYYVDVPSSVNDSSREGWIKFGEPNLDVNLEAEHFVQPKAGRLVLFPSYMWHGTIPFKGPETRLTLPFDVVPA